MVRSLVWKNLLKDDIEEVILMGVCHQTGLYHCTKWYCCLMQRSVCEQLTKVITFASMLHTH